MKGWSSARLGDAIKTNCLSIVKGYPHEKILYLDTGSITCGKVEALQELELEAAPSRAKRIVQDNDIVYSAVRPIQRHYGFIKNPPDNLIVSTGFVVITCDQKKIFPKYLYHYLTANSQVEELDMIAEASTSTYPSLKPEDIENLNVFFPEDVEEQKAIASVLSSLDDKIDLLNRQNTMLEVLAETLFRKMFVEEAREDWVQGRLGDILASIESGSRPKGGIDPDLRTGVPSIGAENINGIGNYDFSKTKYVSEEFYQSMNRGKIQSYDVLVYKDGAYVGRKGMFGNNFPFDVCTVNEHVFILRGRTGVNQSFLYFLLQQEELAQLNTNSAQPGLNQESMKSFEITLPPQQLINSFGEIVKPWIDKIFFNSKQIRSLEKLRDTLLPKLMSGEVRVRY